MGSQFVQYKNSNIHFQVEGAGSPVVLIHGFGEEGSIWKNQIAFLKKEYLLIIPDLPGSGHSDILDDITFDPTIGMEIYAKVIKTILDHLNISSCTMIGHSMGGYITLAFAEKYPQFLEKFGLFHSSAFADNEEKVQTRTKAIEFVKANGAHAFLKTSIPGLFSEKFKELHKQEVDTLVSASAKFSDEAIIQYYHTMIARPDRTKVLTSFGKPILFIIGEKDTAIPLDQSLKQCHQPFISVVHLLSDVAHMGMLEDADKCNTIILSFLKM